MVCHIIVTIRILIADTAAVLKDADAKIGCILAAFERPVDRRIRDDDSRERLPRPDSLRAHVGGATADYFRMLMLDVRHHLIQISSIQAISLDARGGSLRTIMSPIPFLLYARHVFLGEGDTRKAMETKLGRLLESGENVEEAAALSFWILSLEEWSAIRLGVLKNLLRLKAKQMTEDLFGGSKGVRDAIFMFLLVNKVQRLVKTMSGIPAVVAGNDLIEVRNHTGQKWLAEFFERILEQGSTVTKEFEDLSGELDEILVMTALSDDCSAGRAARSGGVDSVQFAQLIAYTNATCSLNPNPILLPTIELCRQDSLFLWVTF
jgi:hypothetical protein